MQQTGRPTLFWLAETQQSCLQPHELLDDCTALLEVFSTGLGLFCKPVQHKSDAHLFHCQTTGLQDLPQWCEAAGIDKV